MENVIFAGHGILIIRNDGRLFIEYDAGGVAVQMRRVEVSEEEAQEARTSERDAYEVLITKA